MKQLAHTLVALASALAVHTCYSASLLVNGDAEAASLQGWTPVLSGASTGNTGIIASVTQQEQTGPTVYPYAGSRFFSFAVYPTAVGLDSGEQVHMYQVGASGLTNASLRLRGVFQTDGYSGGDEGEARILILDAASNTIASASSGSLGSPRFPVEQWNAFEVAVGIPSGAASWRVELRGTVRTGWAVNVFWDALEMESLPEYVTIWVSQVEVCWNSLSNALYQVEYRSVLTTNSWLPLGSPVPGTGTTNCIYDAVLPGQPQRYYRVVRMP